MIYLLLNLENNQYLSDSPDSIYWTLDIYDAEWFYTEIDAKAAIDEFLGDFDVQVVSHQIV